jgi:hypothetical protein
MEPHDGQAWPDICVEGAAPAGGTGGKLMELLEAEGPVAVLPPGTENGFWQTGQRTVLPAAFSGTCIAFVQCGQRITWGILKSKTWRPFSNLPKPRQVENLPPHCLSGYHIFRCADTSVDYSRYCTPATST